MEAPGAGVPATAPPGAPLTRAQLAAAVVALGRGFPAPPALFRRPPPGSDLAAELGVAVADWPVLLRRRELELLAAHGAGAAAPPARGRGGAAAAHRAAAARDAGGRAAAAAAAAAAARPAAKLTRTAKTKAAASTGRTYTSKFRGVHQTFPTRRWEAQFRRAGKPTSLGCFDREDEAARAYDKMMLWCELHGAAGAKGGVTNFDPSEYEAEAPLLRSVSQDELVQLMRQEGRRQAASRSAQARRGPRGPPAAQAAAAQAAARGGPGGSAARGASAEASLGSLDPSRVGSDDEAP